MSDAKIAAAARRWNAARLLAVRLENERNAFQCERSEKSRFCDGAPVMETDGTVCWKRVVGPFADGSPEGEDARRLRPDEQCESCRQRYVAHLAMLDANRARGAAIRAMQRLIASESPDAGGPRP